MRFRGEARVLVDRMKIAITGGGGFLGRRLASALLSDARVESVVLADVAPIEPFGTDGRVSRIQGSLCEPAVCAAVAEGADVIVHLAAVVSGQAEADFDLGMKVNLDATRGLLEAARAGGRRPRLVFSSSLAVFGPGLAVTITDTSAVQPQSSYGAQKAIGELLVADYSRKGFVDGRILRLPTVCVRPGRPNAAASSFVSSIIREPIHGERAVCPVGPELELWLSSPRTAVANLIHGSFVPAEALGSQRIVNLPGITVSVAQMLASLARMAGPAAAALVAFTDQPVVRRIVSSWPSRFDVGRALSLGFSRDGGFDDLIADFLADEAAAGDLRRG
jgi:nucleoside-diphosphate-sugar epimerase